MKLTLNPPKKLLEFHMDLPFLPERKRLEKVEKPIVNIHDKTENVAHVKSLKHALNHSLILKKVHRAITFIQSDWLKP